MYSSTKETTKQAVSATLSSAVLTAAEDTAEQAPARSSAEDSAEQAPAGSSAEDTAEVNSDVREQIDIKTKSTEDATQIDLEDPGDRMTEAPE